MLAIGCTGGVGSGKSTVAALLAAKGAVVADADALSRGALAPGSPGLDAALARFGAGLRREDGSLDRQALADIVFSDPAARHDLEAIVHPVVQAGLRQVLTDHAGTDAVVVLDVPLLLEVDGRASYGLDGVLVVDAPEDVCVERLAAGRRMSPEDARRRMAAQMDRYERIARADFVILNLGTLPELVEMVGEAWAWIGRLREELGR